MNILFPRLGKFLAVVAMLFVLSVGAFVTIAYANHWWGGYHWARTTNPLNLKLGDNVSTTWDGPLAVASSDWSASSVLDTTIVTGQSRKNCSPTKGRVEVCNKKYGYNGWLGLAQVWVSGGHITQGIAKMNDTYFNVAPYNSAAWKQFVICQEIGHTFGLNHQDEIFNNTNLGTCMDYTNDPNDNQHPNIHDYDQLETIYAHLDALTTSFVEKSPAPELVGDDIDTSDPSEWGRVVKKSSDGRSSLHEKDLGKGDKVFTFVIWAD